MVKIFLRKKVGDRIVKGHPWVFANELGDTEGAYEQGDIVDLYSYNGSFIGKGFINPHSQIRIRLLTRSKTDTINQDFFRRKIDDAWAYRTKIGLTDNCRVVFSESDGLSGLIIDKYGNYFVIQTLSYGMDRYKETIVNIIQELFTPDGIYEHNDVMVRTLEGLEKQKGFLSQEFDTNILIQENGLKFHADIANGNTMGYYLDRLNSRTNISHFVKGAEVLDVFCGVGCFSLYAAKHGAKSVLGVDLSKQHISLADKNAEINNYKNICAFSNANAFDFLKQEVKKSKKYDTIILDPPAFTNSKSNITKALNGYKEINLRAIQLLNTNGFLLTSSSSAHINQDQLLSIIQEVAADAKKQIRLIDIQKQSYDYPSLPMLPTTQYYKMIVIQIIT